MDLARYTCRGFSGDFDRIMRDVPVAGIDKQQAQRMIRLCDATEAVLYGPRFSPQEIRYYPGARPALERIVGSALADRSLFSATKSNNRSAEADPTKASNDISAATASLMRWVQRNVRHPHFTGPLPPDRALSEEHLIESGGGYCNEQCRVFIALCQVMQIPTRLCFLFHANARTAHTATEVFLDGKWIFHDVSYGVRVLLPDGSFAEARQLQREFRQFGSPSLSRAAESLESTEY